MGNSFPPKRFKNLQTAKGLTKPPQPWFRWVLPASHHPAGELGANLTSLENSDMSEVFTKLQIL